MALVTLLIAAGSISAMVFAGPRVYYAMARDGLFLPGAARVHPAWRTPAAAIMAQGFWASLLVISGTFDQLALYTGFAVVLFATVAVTALFVLRRRYPNEPRPFRAFQGWRYLAVKDTPRDLDRAAPGAGKMPENLRRELRELGLL